MKAFQLNVLRIVAIIYCASIGIVEVFGTPKKHKASDGREYLIETEYEYNWFEAQHECARHGRQLVTIDSEEKNTIIIDLLKQVIGEPRNLWLGGHDSLNVSQDVNRPFYWLATGNKLSYSFWAPNNPNNLENAEHCLHICEKYPQYQWNDISCSRKMGFICENNPYIETYNKILTYACDAANKLNRDVFIKFEHLQKANMDQMNTRLQSFEQVARDGKEEMQNLKNIIDPAVQKLMNQQELTAKKLWEKLQKQVTDLSGEMKRSADQINANFDEKLNASISSVYRNVVVIKQGE